MTNLPAEHRHSPIEPSRLAGDEGPIGYHRAPEGFDGSRIARMARQNYKTFLLVVALVFGATILITSLRKPRYTAAATILLDQRKQQISEVEGALSTLPPDDSSIVDTEVEILRSDALAEQVVRQLDLVHNPLYQAPKPAHSPDEALHNATDILQRGLTVKRVGLTYVINLTYVSKNAQDAARVVNTLAQSYVDGQIARRRDANDKARAYLQQKINSLQAEVKSADQSVSAYRTANNLSGATAAGTLTDQEISAYNQALSSARAQSAEDAQRLAVARRQLAQGDEKLGDTTSNDALRELRQQQANISARVASLSARYGPRYPDLVQSRQELDDVTRQIDTQSKRSIATLEAQAAASSGRAAEIERKLSQTQSQLARGDRLSVRLHELQGQLDAPKALLTEYQTREAQLATQSGAEQADARIVTAADTPDKPSSPSWPISIGLGIALGIIAGFVAVLARELGRTGVDTPAEVEGMFGVEFVAALPRVQGRRHGDPVDLIVEDPASPFAEAVRSLAAAVFRRGSEAKVVAISSAMQGEGKTTTTLALARSLALGGRRVVVVDCDFQRPTFATRFGVDSRADLIDVLHGQATLDEALVRDRVTDAALLTLNRRDTPLAHQVDFDAFSRLIETLAARYDIVLLDLPPLLRVAEARLLAAEADGTLLLAKWNSTPRSAIEFALTVLQRSGCVPLGIALTQVAITSAAFVGGYGEPKPAQWKLLGA
ncbi:GumC family protein [Sphingomonas nostoxanthinifaciens]|uniref:GumC family protein n=1 Tax=Sphingomonas nostoxanthinifaciens TaxID=2872652 RepID=UPI001CC1E33E|nr:polysaccharide biosynthesis tyrosine autokinase [Sphingomonas nostoxanthinifaciens]UAK23397.1 polysaccharide biosynthesis tyrosine autokinase [Sphingomonas nostoxanthinifaciens]